MSTPFEVGDRARVLESAELGDVRCILPGGWIELELGPGTLITVQPEQIALVARTRVPAAVELEPSPISARELLAEGDSAAGRYADRIVQRADLLKVIGEYLENDHAPAVRWSTLLEAVRGYLVAECDDAIEPESEGLPTLDELGELAPSDLDPLEAASVTVVRLRFAAARRRYARRLRERQAAQ